MRLILIVVLILMLIEAFPPGPIVRTGGTVPVGRLVPCCWSS